MPSKESERNEKITFQEFQNTKFKIKWLNEGRSQALIQILLPPQSIKLPTLKETTNTTATPAGTYYLQDLCFQTVVPVPSLGVQIHSCSVSVQSPRPCSPPKALQFSSCLCPGPVQYTHE